MALGSTPLNPAAKSDRFEKLVNDLKEALGPSSGLTCEDVDVGFLKKLMQEYDAGDIGWQKYAMGDASRGYTRNLVDEGNGKSNLVRFPQPPSPPFAPNICPLCPNSSSLYGRPARAVPSTTTATRTAS